MTSWVELRTAALVGTERRALPRPGHDDYDHGVGLDAERRALHLAAILGVAQRAGWSPPPSTRTSPPELDEAAESHREMLAPPKAAQMLELMISGNAGPGALGPSLYRLWFDECATQHAVLPHRMLVPVLEFGTANARLRNAIVPVLGRRGRWLAHQRARWNWATSADGAAVDSAGSTTDVGQVLELDSEQRLAAARAARYADPRLGRELIRGCCEHLDASSRSRLLGALAVGLSVDDEDLLEAALDDRSKSVRIVGLKLLEQLPGSARAQRLGDWLTPHVHATVKRRKLRLTVDFPPPPEDLQLRDLPPRDRNALIEELWFDALIGGTALGWWEATTGCQPAEIVAAAGDRTDLVRGWMHAALAQQNRDWAQALVVPTLEPALVGLVGADQAGDLFATALKAKVSDAQRLALLAEVPVPWPPALSRRVLRWLQDSKNPGAAVESALHVLANGLPPSATQDLERWLAQAKLEKNQRLRRHLRNLLQQLSFRSSITEAFQ